MWSVGVVLFVLLDGHFPFDVNELGGAAAAAAAAEPAAAAAAAAAAPAAPATQAAASTDRSHHHHHPLHPHNHNHQQQQQQQQQQISSRAIRRLLKREVCFFSGLRTRDPLAVHLIEALLSFDPKTRMQTGILCC